MATRGPLSGLLLVGRGEAKSPIQRPGFVVPKVGVEPTLPEENYALNVARLPVPPLRLMCSPQYNGNWALVNTRIGRAPLFCDFPA